MPLQDHNFIQKKISLRDNFKLRLPKFFKDENDDVIYPQEIIKPLTKYFRDIYQYEAVFIDSWSANKKALKFTVFVPGELTREDFIDDMNDFMEDYPSLKYQLNAKWPDAPEWNKEHEQEIKESNGKIKPRQIGYEMAQNIKTSKKTRTAFSNLSENELSIALKLYESKYHKKPDLESEDDQEELLFLYNNKVEEDRGRLAIVKPSEEYLKKLEREQGKKAAKEFKKKYTSEIYEGGTYDAVVNIFFQTSEFAPNKKGNVDLMNYYEIKQLFRKVNIDYLIDTINELINSSANHASKEEIDDIKNELEQLIRYLKEDLGWIKEWAFKNQLSEKNIKEYNETVSKLEPLLKKIGVKIDFTLPKVGNILSEEDSAKKLKDSIKDEEDPKLTICRLLGEAHDKIMEALDLVEDLENEDELPSSLRYDLEDLEASASEFDFMGESNPVDVLMGTYPIEYVKDEIKKLSKEEPKLTKYEKVLEILKKNEYFPYDPNKQIIYFNDPEQLIISADLSEENYIPEINIDYDNPTKKDLEKYCKARSSEFLDGFNFDYMINTKENLKKLIDMYGDDILESWG